MSSLREAGPSSADAWLAAVRDAERRGELLAAFDLTLTPDELAAIEDAIPAGEVAGDRYDAPQMAALDSEQR